MSTHFDSEYEYGTVSSLLGSDGYEVLCALGSGAGGRVYKAVQLSTGQTVAIKVLVLNELDAATRERRIERFRREIRFCSALYHPDIVCLLDSGELSDGSHFAVFEFIPGCTLADLLRDEGMLKVRRARSLMAHVLPPLAYAHAKGIAHRDLKPGNMMVISDGGRDRLKLLDFGISISVNGHDEAQPARLTQSHEWLGTPLYAAPEQLRGAPTGPKSDLYSWALTFVECLTGQSLVQGKSLLEILNQQSRPDAHVLPAALANHRLGSLLSRVLEKDPARRLGDAELVHSLLERISIDGLEDGQGYLREVSPVSAQYRLRRGTETMTDAEPPPQTEQRQVTALCCRIRLVGAGSMSGVEQVDALFDDSYNLVSEVLRQFGATGVESVGGYSLWYFGISHARDADARLVMRSALEIVNRMETLPRWFGESGLTLGAQIGIHSGPVTLQLSGAARKPVDGATARIAMDLAALEDRGRSATPQHRILVSNDFRQLVERYADLEQHGAGVLQLPWLEQPLPVHRLIGESWATELRVERAPFVGRGSELSRLFETWKDTRAGKGAVVLLEGEAGVGKSRLVTELMMRLDIEGCRTLQTRCLPEWQGAALRPLQLLVAELLGTHVSGEQGPSRGLERALLELDLEARVGVPLFCAWLAVSLPPGYAPLAYSPQKQRQLLHDQIAEFLLATMERGAVLLLEDLHWADPSTLECLDTLLTKSRTRAVLTVLTTRPERAFEWTRAPQVINLVGLPKDGALALAALLVPEGSLSTGDLSKMVARSDGIPLYLEELAMAHGVDSSRTSDAGVGSAEAVPPSLRNLLATRLEVLGPSRETAQFASALAREFSLEMLSALRAEDELSLLTDLEELVSSRVLLKRLRLDSPIYSFRHALIRDAAYESMSADVRRRNHERIATELERRFASLAESQPDVLAYHYERAAICDKAAHYWQLAAQSAASASAYVEASEHVERALAARRRLPEGPESDVLEAVILLTRAAIVVATRGYAPARPDLERIVELVPPSEPTLQLAFAARWGVWNSHNAACNLGISSRLADELRDLADGTDDSALSLTAWAAVCLSRFCTGRLEEAVRASRNCAAAYDIEAHRGLALKFGDDPHVSSGSFEALAEMIRGRHTVAVQRVSEILAVTDQLGYPAQKAAMHGQAAWLYLQWGGAGAESPDYTQALVHAQAAVKISREHGFPFWELYGKLNELAVRVASGETAAFEELKGCAEMWCGFGVNLGRCWHLTYVGQGMHRAGMFSEAQRMFEEALTFCAAHDSRYFESEVRRHWALLLSDPKNPSTDPERALRECRRGSEEARQRGAYWWELACLMTGIRLSSQHDEESLGSLIRVVASLPSSTHEPPLLREARTLIN